MRHRCQSNAGRYLLGTLLAGVAGALAAGAVHFFSPPCYQARALLVQTPLAWEPAKQMPALPEALTELLPWLGLPPESDTLADLRPGPPPMLPMPDYELLFTSESMAGQLHERLAASCPAASPAEIQHGMATRVHIQLQTRLEVQYQRTIELLFTASTPGMAAEGATAWAELAIEAATELDTAALEASLATLSTQWDRRWKEWQDEAAALEAFEKDWNEDLIEARLAALENTAAEQSRRKTELEREVARAQAASDSWTHTLGAVNDSAQRVTLLRDQAAAEALLAGLRAEQSVLNAERPADTEEAARLQALLAQGHRESARLRQRMTELSKATEELYLQKCAAELLAADEAPRFRMVSAAVPPETPAGPPPALLIASAAFLCAAAAPLLLFAWTALVRQSRNPETGEA